MLSKPHYQCTGVLQTDCLVEGEVRCEANCMSVGTEFVVSGVMLQYLTERCFKCVVLSM